MPVARVQYCSGRAGDDGLIRPCVAEPENRFIFAEIAETDAENSVNEKTIFHIKAVKILPC